MRKTYINKDNLCDLYADRIPTSPFLAIIGTSHTVGECEGNTVQDTYGEQIAKNLGLEYLNLGYSGAFSTELLEITTTALDSGLLKNCALLLFEVRLGNTRKQFSKSPRYIKNDDFFVNDSNSSIIISTEQFLAAGLDKKNLVQNSSSNQYWFSANANQPLMDIYHSLLTASDRQKINLTEFDLRKMQSFINDRIYYESYSPLEIYNDMVFVNTMRLLANSYGIKNYWFNISGYAVETSFSNELFSQSLTYANQKNIDYMKYIETNDGPGVFRSIIDKYGEDFYNNNLCKCMHGNQVIHNAIAELLLEKINEAGYNKQS